MNLNENENGKMKSLPIDLIEHSDVAHSLTHSMAKETDTHTHTDIECADSVARVATEPGLVKFIKNLTNYIYFFLEFSSKFLLASHRFIAEKFKHTLYRVR